VLSAILAAQTDDRASIGEFAYHAAGLGGRWCQPVEHHIPDTQGEPRVTRSSTCGVKVRVWEPDTGEHLMTIRRRAAACALASKGSIFAIGDDEGLAVIDIS
jgi:hypothetical protein